MAIHNMFISFTSKIMMFSCILVLTFAVSSISANVLKVDDAPTLLDALKHVHPGDTIQLEDGEYHGIFKARVTGTVEKPILMTGSKKASLSSTSYGLLLDGCSYWTLRGFTLHNSKKGLVLDNSNHNLIDDLEVHHIEEEGVHFRSASSDNVLQNSYIHHTGLLRPGVGEGVYIGSATNHWIDNKVDHSDRNKVLNNRIGPNVGAEEIDIKEGTCCGLISGNHFDGTGMSGENYSDSWIDLKGDKYTIENNTGVHSINDGIQVHHTKKAMEGLVADGRGLLGGCHNVIYNQKCTDIKGKCVVVVGIPNNTVVKVNDCTNEVKNSD